MGGPKGQKDQARVKGPELSVHPVTSKGRGPGDWVQSPVATDVIHCVYVMNQQ